MKNVTIYTDGACSGNPGPGGWGAVLIYKGVEKEISGGEEATTNNRMEITAVIKALECLKGACDIDIYSDSAYVIKAFTEGWLKKWIAGGWRTAGKNDVKNADLWQILSELVKIHIIRWHKVKGHSGNPYNERCDKLAVAEIIRY